MVFSALEKFNLPVSSAVLLGDSFSDYRASKNAGCDFIYIDSESDERVDNRRKFEKAGVYPLTFPDLYNAALFLTSLKLRTK